MKTWNFLLDAVFPKRSYVPLLAALVVVLLGCGCVSQKPLPFAHGTPLPAPAGGPSLAVIPTQNLRSTKDNEDKVLQIPECMDPVTVKELQGIGVFSAVELCTNSTPENGYTLHTQLKELRWEVPNHDTIVTTAFVVSLFTGGIGGVIYGSTGTDVFGYANVHFRLENAQTSQPLLDRDFTATEKRRTTKLVCDTPDTLREVSAGALRTIFNQLEAELKELDLKRPETKQQSAVARPGTTSGP
jgi:hypothetical protein